MPKMKGSAIFATTEISRLSFLLYSDVQGITVRVCRVCLRLLHEDMKRMRLV